MAHQGYDLQLTRYGERGWRATFYPTGMEHSATSATGSAWERTAWPAVQGGGVGGAEEGRVDVMQEMEDVMIQQSATASRRRGLVLGCSLLLLSSCAYISRGEYRGGLFLHTAPNYSFQVPDGWRRATVSDYASFGFNQRLLQTFNETARRAFMELAEREVRLYEALLISSRGAWIHVEPAVNSDVRYPSGYKLNDQEKQSIWQRVSAELVRQAMPSDKPKLTLESMELVDYGPNTVL